MTYNIYFLLIQAGNCMMNLSKSFYLHLFSEADHVNLFLNSAVERIAHLI
jgi:hypothetical protein